MRWSSLQFINVLLLPESKAKNGLGRFAPSALPQVSAFEFSRIFRRDRVGKKKNLEYCIYFFLVNVQCCVSVSASNFQVLTRKSDGARALGNIVRSWAGPARM